MTSDVSSDLQLYSAAVQRLLSHGGYERTGSADDARAWGRDHTASYLESQRSARGRRPDERPTVHVAGSKGKGSVSIMVEALLRAAGASTLLLTQPDIHSARERITIDGLPVSHARFTEQALLVLDDPVTRGWSYYELIVVMGWLAGARACSEWQVLEVGLGGRLDTTNTIAEKQVAVITPIDLEHTEILGDTIPQIATEKAGIITGPCQVVVSPMHASALDVVRKRARECGAELHEASEECSVQIEAAGLHGYQLELQTPVRTYRRLHLPLLGQHQLENATVALRVAEVALASQGGELPEAAARGALAAVRLPVRMETVRQRPLTVLDGAHTALAAERLGQALRSLPFPRERLLVLSMLRGKNTAGVVNELVGAGDTVILAPAASQRAAGIAEMADAVTSAGATPEPAGSVAEAIDTAMERVSPEGLILLTGSMYAASEAREHLLGVAGDRQLGLR